MTRSAITRAVLRSVTLVAATLAGNWLGAAAHTALTGRKAHGVVCRGRDGHGRTVKSVPVAANFWPALLCAALLRPHWAFGCVAGFVASLVDGDELRDRLMARARQPVPGAPIMPGGRERLARGTGQGPASPRCPAGDGVVGAPGDGEVAITVSGLCKRYGELLAVDDVSFEARRGEILGLLGPNGAGKTTTLECVEALRQPDGGSVLVMGIDPARRPGLLRNAIGVQLQSGGLPAEMQVHEAMRFFAAYHGVAPRFDLLERLGLSGHTSTQYGRLSTGLQRRLSLALALAHDPPVLILDEPTAGLDVASRAVLHDLVREARDGGAAIVLATHDMAEAEKLADRVAILLRGRIVAVGTPREITSAGSGITKVSVRTANASLARESALPPGALERAGVEDYDVFSSTDPGATVTAILRVLAERGDRLEDLRVERPSLEERFLEITAGGER